MRAARIQSEQNPTRKVTHRATAHEQQQLVESIALLSRQFDEQGATIPRNADFERSEGFFFMFSARSSGN